MKTLEILEEEKKNLVESVVISIHDDILDKNGWEVRTVLQGEYRGAARDLVIQSLYDFMYDEVESSDEDFIESLESYTKYDTEFLEAQEEFLKKYILD